MKQAMYLSEQTKTALHFCQKQFSSFANFSSFFVLLIWDILDIASERDAIGGDFKWESQSRVVVDMK